MLVKFYVFGYGSLVNSDDLALTINRKPLEATPARLNGWIRDWSVILDSTTICLNVRPTKESEKATDPNGIIFEVSKNELKLLDQREKHYRRVNITKHINIPLDTNDQIFTYTGLDKFTSIDNARPIPDSYLNVVKNGFDQYGKDYFKEFIKTTLPVKVIKSSSSVDVL